MQIGLKRSLLFLLLLAGATGLRVQTIITVTFDDIAAFSMPAEQYAGLDLHFDVGSAGV